MKTIGQIIDQWISELAPEDRERFEERSAIREFDGLQSRDEAERGAYADIRAKVDEDKVQK